MGYFPPPRFPLPKPPPQAPEELLLDKIPGNTFVWFVLPFPVHSFRQPLPHVEWAGVNLRSDPCSTCEDLCAGDMMCSQRETNMPKPSK